MKKAQHDPSAPVHEAKAELFRVLGHPARVRVLELLRDGGEMPVGALQEGLGIDSGGTSQHLAALRAQGLVESRRQGTSVFYRVADPAVFTLLDAGRGVVAGVITRQQAALRELAGSLDSEASARGKRPAG